MTGTFAVTDPDWLETLSAIGAIEANFWQPRPTRIASPEGTPWIFKVRGSDRVAGFGFFSYWTTMPLSIAWETFGAANGVRSFREMALRVESLRRSQDVDEKIGCVVLSDVTVLARSDWIAAPNDWKKNVVRVVGYDLDVGEGARVWNQLRTLALANSAGQSPLLRVDGGVRPAQIIARRGQGAFRLMVMDAYDRRCAVTGERTLPVLEAAHIRPFAETREHDVRNGILMRSDIHRLYDRGLVTVSPDLTFRVSRSIERDYSNGLIYYALDGNAIRVPSDERSRPDLESLAWHEETVFRP